MKKSFTMFLLILLILPVVYASNYSSGNYGDGVYGGEGSGFNVQETPDPDNDDRSGGRSSDPEETLECSLDSDCESSQHCINNQCYDLECVDDSVCDSGSTCWNFKCVKLFDIEIIDFSSPIKLGDHFSFTYSLYGRAEINRDVEVKFWVEQDGKEISSGKDTIYVGSFEKKQIKTELFLPDTISSGTYKIHIETTFGTYSVESFRTIEITVEEDIVEIELKPETSYLTVYIICFIIGLGFFILHFITYLRSRKDRKKEQEENRAQLINYLKLRNNMFGQ